MQIKQLAPYKYAVKDRKIDVLVTIRKKVKDEVFRLDPDTVYVFLPTYVMKIVGKGAKSHADKIQESVLEFIALTHIEIE